MDDFAANAGIQARNADCVQLKRRTDCRSCGVTRMATEAAHLVERVLADVSVRHWVLSVPFDIRYYLAKDRSLLSAVLRIFVDVLSKWTSCFGESLDLVGSNDRVL